MDLLDLHSVLFFSLHFCLYVTQASDSTMDEKGLKADGESGGRDFDLGQVLAVQTTPEEERKLLWKLDLL